MRRSAVKAVLYRKTGLPASRDYEKIVLVDDAVALHVNGDFLMVQQRQNINMTAATKLGDHDYVKFED
jgi:hypothetical protein